MYCVSVVLCTELDLKQFEVLFLLEVLHYYGMYYSTCKRPVNQSLSALLLCRACSHCLLLLPEGNAQYGQQQEAYQQGPPQQQAYPPQQQYPAQQGYPPQQQGYGE